ncbi:MAG TPA: hypothetical protein VFQ65_21895 [Kofleriaceae bacterium]|nr:hypothetical protein [Kofleriaceae bacterium]
MDLIARVEGSYGVHFVRIAPIGARFQTNVRPRPAVGSLITITFVGLDVVNADSLEAWRAGHARTDELDRRFYKPTVLADLMSAGNADLWFEIAREASADQLAAFALDRGGALLADIRTELAGAHRVERVIRLARRFASILAVPWAADTLAELAELHEVEQLMGLEHAVVSWMRAAAEPEVKDLARELPDARVSAGVSSTWLQWWWQLAHTCTRADLREVVEAAVGFAKQECRYGEKNQIAREACDEASAMADRMRVAPRAELFAEPPRPLALGDLMRDDGDAHYCAYMAVTHAAHAIAAALRADLDAGEANQHAMQLVAKRALELVR